ncbi:MAG: response regulator [Haloferacaceae archaeon]
MHESARATVLIVDDDPDVVQTYQRYLEADYDVVVAYDGEGALDTLESEDVDVVLLDRMMPGLSGGEVLERIEERGDDCRVAMVTAVDPDFDIIDMGFDDYVTKPSSGAELRSTVAELVALDEYARGLRQYHSLVAKRAALESKKTDVELAASDEFSELESRIEQRRAELDEGTERLLEDAAFVTAIRSIDEDTGGDVDGR